MWGLVRKHERYNEKTEKGSTCYFVYCLMGCTDRTTGWKIFSCNSPKRVLEHMSARHGELFKVLPNLKGRTDKKQFEVFLEAVQRSRNHALANYLSADFLHKSAKKVKFSRDHLTYEERGNLMLAAWQIACSIPRNAFDHPIFKAFHLNQTGRKSPNRKNFGNELLETLYHRVRKLEAQPLITTRSVSLSIDGWRDPSAREFVAVIAHMMDPEFKRLDWVTLAVRYIYG